MTEPHAGHDHDPEASAVDCSSALLRVFEYLDGEMGEQERAAIHTHLMECVDCLKQYRLDEMVKIVVRRSMVCESAPTHLRQTIMRSITTVRFDVSE